LIEIPGQGRLKVFPLAGARMSKPDFPSMQHLPEQMLFQARCIHFVPEYGVAEMVKMHTNLVRATAVQPALN